MMRFNKISSRSGGTGLEAASVIFVCCIIVKLFVVFVGERFYCIIVINYLLVCCKTIYVIVDVKLCVINFFRHFLFNFWYLFDLVGCMHMLDCCLRWLSAR
jgi:hypothetical protein